MSSMVIKCGLGVESVLPFAIHTAPAPAAVRDVQSISEDPQLLLLRQELSESKAALAAAYEAAARGEAAAREDGRREAQAAIREEGAERLRALQGGLAVAADAWQEKLNGLDALSALLARQALAKLFDESADQAELVIRALARQIQTLRREAIVAVRVSAGDFPDRDSLARAAATAGAVEVIVDPTLSTGDCRVDLQLGHVDLGIRHQWEALSELLVSMAEAEPAT